MEPQQDKPGSDRELMARLGAGDKGALAPLMERHYRRLYRLALSYLRQPDDALDTVQEAFVKAWQNAARWDGSAEAGPWLSRIAINLSIDRWRRNRRRQATFTPLAEIATTLGMSLGTVKSSLHRALHRMRERLREVRP